VGKLKDYWNSGEKKEEAASASSGGQAARTGTQGVSSAKPGIKEYYSGYSAKPAGTQPAASGSAGGVSYTPPERDRKQLTASLTEQVAGYMRNPSYGESYASARRAQETRERNAAARAAAAASETQAAGRSAAEITADISAGRTAKNETGKAYADLLAREETLKKSLSAAEETRNASYERFLRELDAYPDLSETERQELISGWHDDQYDEALRNYNEQHGALAESLESAKRADEDAASALEDYWSELYENAYGAPDFAERSKYRSTANGRENYLDPLGEYYSLGYDSEEYERVNRNRDVIDILEAYEASSGLRRAGLDEGQIAEMNDDEIAMYNYLYSAVSPETASEYLRNITSDLNYRERMRTETEARKRADENPGQAQAEIILRNLAKRDEYLYQWLDKLDDKYEQLINPKLLKLRDCDIFIVLAAERIDDPARVKRLHGFYRLRLKLHVVAFAKGPLPKSSVEIPRDAFDHTVPDQFIAQKPYLALGIRVHRPYRKKCPLLDRRQRDIDLTAFTWTDLKGPSAPWRAHLQKQRYLLLGSRLDYPPGWRLFEFRRTFRLSPSEASEDTVWTLPIRNR